MRKFLFVFLYNLLFLSYSYADNSLKKGAIVTTIAPVYALVQSVLGNTANAVQLVPNGASVHGYRLKPSQYRSLHNADLVFMISAGMERFAIKALEHGAENQRARFFVETPGIRLLYKRQADDWHGHEATIGAVGLHSSQGNLDYHLWLDPLNAVKILTMIRAVLVERYPHLKSTFEQNTKNAQLRIKQLHNQLVASMVSINDKPYIVLHDAYGYFESRYKLNPLGAVIVNASHAPTAGQIKKIRKAVIANDVVCVFGELQYSDKWVRTITEGSTVKSAILDPLGMSSMESKTQYIDLMMKMGNTFLECLSAG